ncbi:hypothetical protein GY14_08765 [Delftia tsuruhatensis]|nr:hypothetical protein GY14_08765 [Delftia tsuruhatensis]
MGRASGATRSAWPSDLSLSRALASASGTPSSRQMATRLGQTSVSMSTPTAGLNCCTKRRTAAGVSQGCQTCRSPDCSSRRPSVRPVAVPWVSSRRMPGRRSRSAVSKMAAARVSPSDTA